MRELTAKGLVEYVKEVVDTKETVYMWGSFGQRVTDKFIQQKAKQYPSWYTSTKVNKFKKFVGQGVYALDCVGLIKSYVWGGIDNLRYDAIQDKSADGMFQASRKGGQIETIPEVPGVLVCMAGHIGVYIGNGEVIECTPAWKGGVQKTRLSQRKWKCWCECPYIDYTEEVEKEETVVDEPSSWAKEICEKAVATGLIQGDGKGNFGWKEPLTLERFLVIADKIGLVDK